MSIFRRTILARVRVGWIGVLLIAVSTGFIGSVSATALATAPKHPRCRLLRTGKIRSTLHLASLSGPSVQGSTCYYHTADNPNAVIISNFHASLHDFQQAKAYAHSNSSQVYPLSGFGSHAFWVFYETCSACSNPHHAYGLTVLKGSSMVVATADPPHGLTSMEHLMRKLLKHVP